VPALFFHGSPGGRAFDLGKAVADHGVWLFVLERPGVGLSDPRPGATVLDWAGDVALAADELGFERFAVAGASAGARFALACGHRLPDRVTVVVLLSPWVVFADEPELDGLLPDDFRVELAVYRSDPTPQLEERYATVQARCEAWARDPDGLYRELFGEAADVLPAYWLRMLEANYGEDRFTPADFAEEYEPWGFSARDVSVPVRAWHGDADDSAPLSLVEELIRRLPDGNLTVCPGEGHFLHPRHRAEYLPVLANSR
jgi:pimeloyl-ACP methyl ester carboxylesterase